MNALQFILPTAGLALVLGGFYFYNVSRAANSAAELDGDPAYTGERKRLDPRREGFRETVTFEFSGKVSRDFEVTFNWDESGAIREVFCAGAHTQSDLQGLVEDACIAISRALQFGDRIADLAKCFGELRDEGAESGPPASPLGLIARVGARIEAEFAEGAP